LAEQVRRSDRLEPKSNQNPRYLRYANAASAMRWIIDDLARERALPEFEAKTDGKDQ
jgi:hypothetical protein